MTSPTQCELDTFSCFRVPDFFSFHGSHVFYAWWKQTIQCTSTLQASWARCVTWRTIAILSPVHQTLNASTEQMGVVESVTATEVTVRPLICSISLYILSGAFRPYRQYFRQTQLKGYINCSPYQMMSAPLKGRHRQDKEITTGQSYLISQWLEICMQKYKLTIINHV